ncbi:DUF368 domain-containing protein [Paenibacillus tarimensis]|uniref:DUF368 domain-containing protein n=1 Tax=Paenibacillus tarimensis TaxID=416012 RepID=UPI001F159B4D|nr:DUF368 domain-containing protein [Paenibacillus tarimensis]MCF2943575.1 DUF368 domain-containing protein [Paenibacillus tarimensis]
MMEWRNIIRGVVMGISDLIPGVSGGTMALALGIYKQLLEAINGIFSRSWKQHFAFLIPLGIGILAAVFTLSGLMEWLLEHHPKPTFFFFLGLILGIIPLLLRKIEYKKSFRASHYLLIAIAAVLVALTAFAREDGLDTAIKTFTTGDYIFLFFAGWLASSAMILPGISGSFVLLLLGAYPTVIGALSDRNLLVIGVVGCGVVIGILVMSRLIHFLLAHYTAGTYAVIIGMVVGSIVVVFPGFTSHIGTLVICLVTLIIGYGCSLLIGRFDR